MGRGIPENFRLDASIAENMLHLVGKAGQVAHNGENFLLEPATPAEMRLYLAQVCAAAEQAGAFVSVVTKWCVNLPFDVLEIIPTGVLLDAEANSK